MLCNLLGVSTTAYYRFCSEKSYQISQQKANKLQAVEEVFWEHKRRYGSRRITAGAAPLNCKQRVTTSAAIKYVHL